jgi:hypothetical protein
MALWLIALLLLILVLANPAARKILLGVVGIGFWLGVLGFVAGGGLFALFYWHWVNNWGDVVRGLFSLFLIGSICARIFGWIRQKRQQRYERSVPPVLPVFNHLDPFSAESQSAVARLREREAQSKENQGPPARE